MSGRNEKKSEIKGFIGWVCMVRGYSLRTCFLSITLYDSYLHLLKNNKEDEIFFICACLCISLKMEESDRFSQMTELSKFFKLHKKEKWKNKLLLKRIEKFESLIFKETNYKIPLFPMEDIYKRSKDTGDLIIDCWDVLKEKVSGGEKPFEKLEEYHEIFPEQFIIDFEGFMFY